MAISLYDISIPGYLQVLGSVHGILEKGAKHAQEHDLDPAEIVTTRLSPDMLPFHFQVVSVCHHSIGAIKGIREGLFQPPPTVDLDYAGLLALVDEAIAGLQAESRVDIDAMEGKPMKFKVRDFELPFTAENFILSFSLPNFYFHATTAYDILRIAGVPLGKMDYLGELRTGA